MHSDACPYYHRPECSRMGRCMSPQKQLEPVQHLYPLIVGKTLQRQALSVDHQKPSPTPQSSDVVEHGPVPPLSRSPTSLRQGSTAPPQRHISLQETARSTTRRRIRDAQILDPLLARELPQALVRRVRLSVPREAIERGDRRRLRLFVFGLCSRCTRT